jgi:hypothetical protein
MPENQQDKTTSVLKDYIATRNKNPQMDTETLKTKFPEIGQFAALNQVSSDEVVSELDNYYNKYRTGQYNNLDDLNAASPFFFQSTQQVQPTQTETVAPTTGIETGQPDQVVQPDQPIVEDQPKPDTTVKTDTPEGVTDQVLKDYIATRNKNPELTTDELKKKFPEVSQYAALTQTNSDELMDQLNNLYNDYKSNKFNSFEELSAKYNFAEPLKKKEETGQEKDQSQLDSDTGISGLETGVSEPVEAPKDSITSVMGTETSEKGVEDFVSNIAMSPKTAVSTISKAYQPKNGIDPLATTKKAIESNVDKPFIKRMFESTIVDYDDNGNPITHKLETGVLSGKYIVFPTVVDKDGVAFKPKDPYSDALQNNNFISFDNQDDAEKFASGEWQVAISQQEDKINEERRKAGLPPVNLTPFEYTGPSEDGGEPKSMEDAKNLYGEWSYQTFEESEAVRERIKKELKKQRERMNKEYDNILQTQFSGEENDKRALLNPDGTPSGRAVLVPRSFGENMLIKDIQGQEVGIPDAITPDSHPFLFDNTGQMKPGAYDSYQAAMRRASNNYLLNIANDKKQEVFNRYVEQSGGDNEEANRMFFKENERISKNFLSESDLKIFDLQKEIIDLENIPEEKRGAGYDVSLRNKKNELKNLKGAKELYDPSTGTFISGNEKIEGKAMNKIKSFNTKVDNYQIKYEETDVGDLFQIRDELYYKYKSYVEDVMLPNWDPAFTPNMNIKYVDSKGKTIKNPAGWAGINEVDAKAVITYEDTADPNSTKSYEVDLSTPAKREKFTTGKITDTGIFVDGLSDEWNSNLEEKRDNLLAEYMGINRVIALNIDPGTVDKANFFESLGIGITKGLGGTSFNESELADRTINDFENSGITLTDNQKEKIDKDFWTQKLPETVGSSIPASIEIGFNIMAGNKAAGVLKVGKMAKNLAKGNKATELFLNVAGESAIQGFAFNQSGESAYAGVGEGVGQSLGGMLLSKFGVKNRLLNFGARLIAGGTTETMAEFSGQFIDELSKEGVDFTGAVERTFGSDLEEFGEKLALTYITALTLGIGGAGQDSKMFLEKAKSELSAIESDSELIKYAKSIDVTTPFTEEDAAQLDEYKERIDKGESLTDKEFIDAEMLETRKKVSETGETEASDAAPVVKHGSGDVEYKVGDKFYSEEEMSDLLDNEEFVDQVKNSEVPVEMNNPSAEVKEKLKEKFPLNENEKVIEEKLEKSVEGLEPVTQAEETEVTPGAETEAAPEITQEAEETPELLKPNDGKDRDFQSFTGEETEITLSGLNEKGESAAGGSVPVSYEVRVSRKNDQGNFQIDETKEFDTVEEAEKFANETAAQDSSVKGDVEQKTQQDAIQEQQTKEIPLRAEAGGGQAVQQTQQQEQQVEQQGQEQEVTAEESLNQVSEDVSNVSEGVAPFSTKKVFDSTIQFAKDVAKETGLTGAKLVTEIKNRLNEKIGENFDPEDIDAISGEITEAVDTELKAGKTAEVTPEATPEKKIKEKSKKIAEAIRSAKAPPDLSKLSSDPRPIFTAAWNSALEATALTVEAGGAIAQAVADGVAAMKKSTWYKNLSDEGKQAAEEQVKSALESQITEQESKIDEEIKKPKKKKPTKKEQEAKQEKKTRKKAESHRQSKVALRHAETLKEGKEKKGIIDKTRYEVANQEDAGKKIDELYDEMGGWEGAIEYVEDPKNNVDKFLKETLKMDAAAKMISEGRRIGDIEMQKKGQSIEMEKSLERTVEGQINSFINELYKRNPGVFWRRELSKITEKGTSEALNQQHSSDGQTVGEAIEEARAEVKEEMVGLKEEIAKLTVELEGALEQAKKTSERQDSLRAKKKRAKEKRAAGLQKIKKGLKGQGGTANAGIDPTLLEGVLDVVASYIEEGVTSTRLIVNRTYNLIKNAGGNLTKANIENIAQTLDEFNSLKKIEDVNTFYEKVKQILNTKEPVDASTIDQLVENPNSLWTQYQQNILSTVNAQVSKMSSRAKTPEQKAELDKLSREIAREINQKISEVSNSNKRRTKDVKSSKDVLIDLMANSDKIQEVYNQILSDPKVPVEVKNAIMAVVDSEVVFSRTLVSNLINEEAAMSGKKLADIVAMHYSGKQRFVGDLAESLVREAGLNTEEARFVSDFLKSKMDSIIQEKAEKAVENFLRKSISAEDIQAALDSGNVSEEIQKEIDKRLRTKENRKLIKRVTKAINLGAINDPRFTDAFAEKFGFRDIDETTKAKFHQLVDEIEELRAPENTSKTVNGKEVNTFQQERVEALEKELNTLIDTLSKKNFAYVAENLVAFKYFAILSGISTQIRAMTGAILGSGLNTLAFGIRNVASMRGMLLGMANGFNAFKAASSRATLARKDALIATGKGKGGFELYASEKQGGATKSKLTGVERLMLRGWSKAMEQFKKGQPVKGSLNAMAYALLQPMRMFHLLGASDAFFSSSLPQFIMTVQVYNKMAKEMKAGPLQTFTGMGKKNNTNGGVSKMSLVERTQLALAQDAESKAVFESIAEEEYQKMSDEMRAEMRKEGVPAAKFEKEFDKRMRKRVGGVKRFGNPKSTYKNRRKQELIENQNLKRFNYAVGMTKDWLLIGTPDGIAGAAAQGAQGASRIDPTKDGTGKSILKLLFQWNVMFLRLSANSWNQIKTGVPFLGALDAFLGFGVDPNTGEIKTKGETPRESFDLFLRGKWKADRERSYQRLMVNVISTTAAAVVFQEMFKWDDDEDDYVLNPDRAIDVLGPGNFRMSENRRAIEDFQKFSFSITKGDEGGFTDYIRTNLSPQSQGIVAFLSAFSDDYRGLGSKKAIKEREGRVTPKFIKGVVNNPFQAWWEGSFNSIGRLIKSSQGEETTAESFMAVANQIALDNTKALLQPAIYRDVTKYVQSETGGKQKEMNSFTDRFLNGFYGLDFMLENRTDMFGNEYPITDVVDQWITGVEKMSEENKDVALLYKFDGGLQINPWRPTNMEKFGQFKFSGYKFESKDNEVQDRIVTRQQELFKELVNENMDLLESIDNKDLLEDSMKKLQTASKDQAKNELVPKLLDEGLISIVTE